MSYLKQMTERFQQMEDRFRRHHQSFVGGDLIPELRKAVKAFEYELVDDITVKRVQIECNLVFRDAEVKNVSYILPNTMKRHPYAWNLAEMTEVQRQAALPSPYYVAVKGIRVDFGKEQGQIVYDWDLQHLHGRSNFPLPPAWEEYQPKPLTCTKGADLYFWADEDGDLQVGLVTANSILQVTWYLNFDPQGDETWLLAQLCLRQLGILPWPNGFHGGSLL